MDVNRLFANAEAAFTQGRFTECRKMLAELTASVGPHPNILHLQGLSEKRLGALNAARDYLSRAREMDPSNPEIANNLGTVLVECDALEDALLHFERASLQAPGWAEAGLNRAITLHGLRRFDAARAAFAAVHAGASETARYWSAVGMMERDAGDLDAAAAAFDRALAIKPDHPGALKGRARVALERGEAEAAARHRSARMATPDDPELLLGEAEALEAAGDPGGIALLADAVSKQPGWVAGHEALARMRWEAGHGPASMESYARALDTQPGNRSLHASHWNTLIRAERHADALAALDRARANFPSDDDELALTEGLLAGECGDIERSEAALARVPHLDAAVVARARNALRGHDPARAAALLEPLTASDPGHIGAWAYLSLAWRLMDDPRHQWLCGQEGLVGARQLELDAPRLSAIAETLRDLHRTRAHPIGQSLRGGTQTRGRLFARTQPAITELRDAIMSAVGQHLAGLPPADPSHPLLRHRDGRFALGGSWSVRLTQSGFHVHHIHPQGVVSSACYLSLPDSMGAGDSRDGWLELGASPGELGLALGPMTMIEPLPGRLALFPSYMFHGTRPFAAGERLTAAFDLVPA